MKSSPVQPSLFSAARISAAELDAIETRLLRGPVRADVSVVTAYRHQLERDLLRLINELRQLSL